jgi:hypothetical protein
MLHMTNVLNMYVVFHTSHILSITDVKAALTLSGWPVMATTRSLVSGKYSLFCEILIVVLVADWKPWSTDPAHVSKMSE